MAENTNHPSTTPTGPLTATQAGESLRALFFPPEGADARDTDPDAPPVDPETGAPLVTDEGAESPEAEPTEEPERDEEQPDAEPEPEPEPEPSPTYKVKVNGELVEVTLDELKNGYSRTKDYTQKTQEAARLRKEAEEVQRAAAEKRDRYLEMLKQTEAQLEASVKEPDWETLRTQVSQTEFLALKEDWREYQEGRQKLAAETKRVAEEKVQEQATSFRTFVEQERAAYPEVIPAWKNPKVHQAESARMVQFLNDLGYGEMLPAIVDRRLVALVRDAMLYREGRSKTTTPGAGAQPSPTPGAQARIARARLAAPGAPRVRPSESQKRKDRAFARVKTEGSVSAAGAAIAELLKGSSQKGK